MTTISSEGQRLRVLVVDDEPMIAKSIGRVLHGVTVQSAESGKQALEILALEAPFDLLLCDLMMPDMNGMEFYMALNKRWPEVTARVVFMSGGSYVRELDDFLGNVPNRHLKKPFSSDELRLLVAEMSGG
ncbi:MAG TPA: response regulator [Polyangiaceae bacterium]|nr:response regulator [Polyangiaceae bacterium]